MTNDALQPVAADQLRIAVEMGEDYEPTERVAKALAELTTALAEADAANADDDVQGFLDYLTITMTNVKPFVYDSRQSNNFESTVGNKQEPYLKIYKD